MADSSKNKERLKLAVIPLLLIVLVAVLLVGDDEAPSAVPELLRPEDRPAAKTDSHGGEEGTRRDIVWPSYSLNSILAHNPFRLQDPRAILDAELLAVGITSAESMTEISTEEFFPQEPEEKFADREAEEAFLTALLEWGTPEQPVPDETQIQAAETSTESQDLSANVPPANMDAEQSAVARQKAQRVADQQRNLIKLQQRLVHLQHQPVTMIMTSVRGNSALLGGRNIVEGELVEDGIRATSIGRDGITFEIVEASPSAAE